MTVVHEHTYLLVGQGRLGDEVGRGHGRDDVEEVELHAELGAVGHLLLGGYIVGGGD